MSLHLTSHILMASVNLYSLYIAIMSWSKKCFYANEAWKVQSTELFFYKNMNVDNNGVSVLKITIFFIYIATSSIKLYQQCWLGLYLCSISTTHWKYPEIGNTVSASLLLSCHQFNCLPHYPWCIYILWNTKIASLLTSMNKHLHYTVYAN